MAGGKYDFRGAVVCAIGAVHHESSVFPFDGAHPRPEMVFPSVSLNAFAYVLHNSGKAVRAYVRMCIIKNIL